MYRALLILAILNFVEPHHNWRGRHHNHGDERFFEHLANDIIEADNKAKTFCVQNQETLKEIYGQDKYKLIINLPNFNESAIEVKTKHRVLYIKAEKEVEDKKYTIVKVLPDLLNVSGAKWCYDNKDLTIAAPYKVAKITEVLTGCGEEINSNIINVPKSDRDLNETPDIDARFANPAGNEKTSENSANE